ncbi:MAG: Uma2 family endonuclease [Cyanobacteria bacterium J06636_16]
MTQAITQSKLTFEQYLELPDDGRRTEFVNGEVIEVTEPSPQYIDVVALLGDLLKAHLRVHKPNLVVKSGPGIQISQTEREDNSRDPDLIVCTWDQWQTMANQTKALFLKGNSPLLAIEVVSPGTDKKDTRNLLPEYASAKVSEYWVVNPIAKSVSVWLLQGNEYRLKGEFKSDRPVESDLLQEWDATAVAMLG